MPADPTQHQQCTFQLLFRLDVQRSASILIFNNKTFISFSTGQTNIKSRHSRKLMDVVRNFMRLAIALVIILFSTSSCLNADNSRSTGNKFEVTVQGFALTAGYNLKYQLNEEGIHVVTNCDFEGCKPETKYQRNFAVKESDDFYQFLKSLRIDTLKNNYTQDGVLDGYLVTISIKGDQLPTKGIELSNLQTKTTARLLNKVNSLVTEEKYRFGKWPE